MSHPHVDKGHQYALDVLSGKVIACRWIKLACQRYLDDLERIPEWEYTFNRDKAERVCKFKELFSHVKGKWAARAERYVMEPWQCFFTMNVFGWVHKETGARRFRKVLKMVGRKNGKSFDAAGDGLYMFAADGEYGAEVFSGATTEKQAWEIFRPARLMASKSPQFCAKFGVEVHAKAMSIKGNGSRFEPVIGNPGDGASPSCALVDEYHEHDTDALVDTMETGMGAREQPLLYIVSTAGENTAGPCYALQQDAEKVLDGTWKDETLFAVIYTLDDPEHEWKTIEGLRKSNPNLGVSISVEFLQAQLAEALRSARKQGKFKIKHGNIWVGAKDAYFDLEKYKANADRELKLEDFEGEECFIGMDLASKRDMCAVSIVFPVGPREYVRFGKYYLPEAAVDVESTPHYCQWRDDGWLTVTGENTTDYDHIEEDVIALSRRFNVVEVGFDQSNAQQLVGHLMSNGIACADIPQTMANFSPAMKEIDALICEGKYHHDGNPVQTWMISNTVTKANHREEVYPRKAGDREEAKIDGVVADIMAVSRAMARDSAEPAPISPWDDPNFSLASKPKEANAVR